MLVLSRRVNEQLVFPNIDTTIRVLSSKSGVVRLGIQAPSDIPVYREELIAQASTALKPVAPLSRVPRSLVHQINNRLHAATIGLALLRQQVALGMDQEVADTIGKLEQEMAALRQTVEPLRPSVPAPGPAVVRRRALLVEDDRNERELLAGFLRLAGLEVTTADDGADALDHLRTAYQPDVVLLDMLLPRCDGPTTVRAIRSNPEHAGLTIFGVTGADTANFGLPEGPAGINRWFQKPINPEALLRELERALPRAR